MTIKIIDQKLVKKTWNQIAKHPLQSWSWGEARKEMGIEVLRIAEFSKGELENVYQLTFHKIPYTHFKIGYLPRSTWPSKKVLEFIADYSKKNGVIFVKIEPYVQRKNFQFSIFNFQSNSNFQLLKSKHPLFPQWTQIIDLTKTEEKLLKNMHRKTRYNIRLAQKKGVIVKEMPNEEGFKIFSKLYFETCKRQKYFGHSLRYHRIVWNNLKNNIAHILVAFYQQTPLAAYELFFFKDTFYYPYGGTSLKYRNLMASNLLMWEAIRLGKKLGAKKFDMWGSLPPDYKQTHPWAGFTRFKQGYGGELVEMIGSFDLVVNPFLYKIYNLSYLLRQIYLKIRRRKEIFIFGKS